LGYAYGDTLAIFKLPSAAGSAHSAGLVR